MITSRISFLIVLLAAICFASADTTTTAPSLPRIGVNADKTKLVLEPSNEIFTPWGFNYDRDYKMRLIEDYWITEWPTVERDFRAMKSMGGNIVRIHLSVSQFLQSPDHPNEKNVEQLKKLVQLCEQIGIYLDVTGLGSYRKEAAPDWYVNTTESQRWAIQAKFWQVISQACADSPAIAWFDLANEPIVPSDKKKPGEWMTGHLDQYWYCQYITLDPAGRDRGEIARAWARQMIAAIKPASPHTLITVGMLPFTSTAGHPSIGIDPPALKDLLDLICVHLYPKGPPFDQSLALLAKFDCGKPLVIEEIFPLDCKAKDMPAFIEASKKHADGWISFYWGDPPASEATTQLSYAIARDWLKVFTSIHPDKPKQ